MRSTKSLRVLACWPSSRPARARGQSFAPSRPGGSAAPRSGRQGAPARGADRRVRAPARPGRSRWRASAARARRGPGRAPRLRLRSSGSTAPSSIEARTASSMSSGRTSTAGGGRRPMRCRAARTSTITPRRASSERRMRRFASGQRAETLLDSPDAVFGRTHPFGGLDQGGVQPGPIGRNLGDLGLEPPARFGARGDRLLDGLEVSLAPGLLLRCLMGARRRTVCRSCLRGTSALRPSLNLSGQAHPGQSRAKRRQMGERSETPGRCQEHHESGLVAARAVIRVACEDRERPVDLLHDEHARKLVRQGQSAECGHEIGAAAGWPRRARRGRR